MRAPHVASRPATPGLRASPKYATAASPYASSAGQNRSSANRNRLAFGLDRTLLPRELGELCDLPLEARELRRDDQDVREHDEEDDGIRGRDVLLGRRHAARTSRSSRSRASRRLPASSTW